MKKKEIDLIYALFILASNGKLNRLIKMHKEDTAFSEEFACNNWAKYNPIQHAKEFEFQWNDRADCDELCFWQGNLEDINKEEDETNLTMLKFESGNLGNEYDMMGEKVLIVPLSFNPHLEKMVNEYNRLDRDLEIKTISNPEEFEEESIPQKIEDACQVQRGAMFPWDQTEKGHL